MNSDKLRNNPFNIQKSRFVEAVMFCPTILNTVDKIYITTTLPNYILCMWL